MLISALSALTPYCAQTPPAFVKRPVHCNAPRCCSYSIFLSWGCPGGTRGCAGRVGTALGPERPFQPLKQCFSLLCASGKWRMSKDGRIRLQAVSRRVKTAFSQMGLSSLIWIPPGPPEMVSRLQNCTGFGVCDELGASSSKQHLCSSYGFQKRGRPWI